MTASRLLSLLNNTFFSWTSRVDFNLDNRILYCSWASSNGFKVFFNATSLYYFDWKNIIVRRGHVKVNAGEIWRGWSPDHLPLSVADDTARLEREACCQA